MMGAAGATPAFSRSARAAVVLAALAGAAGTAAPAAAQACTSLQPAAGATAWAPPLSQVVSMRFESVPLRDALARVATVARVRISYSPDIIPLQRIVCVSAPRAPLGDLLAALLHDVDARPISASADHIVLAPTAPAQRQEAHTDSVIVLEPVRADAMMNTVGEPLPGVRVIVLHELSAAEQATSSLAAAFGQAVAGLWLWQQAPGTPIVQYGSIRGTSSFGLTAPRLYIDGVEVANPLLFSRISPDAIERVEVARGPQGAALFGANAINGVMNIVTRAGGVSAADDRTRLRSTIGVAATNYAPGSAAQHDHGINTRFGDYARSINVDVTAGGLGELVSNGGGEHLGATVAGRVLASHATLTATARFAHERAVCPLSPLLSLPPASPYTQRVAALSQNALTMRQYTAGAALHVTSSATWMHSAVVGIDGYSLTGVPELTPWSSDADLALRAAGDNGYRTSARVHTTARGQLAESVLAAMTLGLEHTQLLQSGSTIAFPRAPHVVMRDASTATSRQYYGVSTVPARASQRSAGVSAQGYASLADRLFISAGLRLEQGSSDQTDDHLATLPLLGGSYLLSAGRAELKLRAAYGKGIRWSQLPARATALQRLHAVQRSELVAEEQAGVEAGFDLDVARSFMLHVTRFDQVASGIVQRVTRAAVDTALLPRALRDLRYELQNVGEISNRGWEVEAAFARGPLSIAAAAAIVDSRVQRLAALYDGDLREGDRMLAVPARTLSITGAWQGSGWSAAITAARAFDWINYDRVALARAATDRTTTAGTISGAQLRSFWREYDGVTHLSVRATHDFSRYIGVTVSGENLLNQQIGEPDNITILPGRGISIGVRARF